MFRCIRVCVTPVSAASYLSKYTRWYRGREYQRGEKRREEERREEGRARKGASEEGAEDEGKGRKRDEGGGEKRRDEGQTEISNRRNGGRRPLLKGREKTRREEAEYICSAEEAATEAVR